MLIFIKNRIPAFVVLALLTASSAFADQATGAPGQSAAFFQGVSVNSMMAGSPMSDYTIHVMVYMLILGVLLSFLMGGAFAVINLGLLSKRAEDQTGKRDPSDVGILKHAQDRSILPAEEGKLVDYAESLATRREISESVTLLSEDEMYDTSKSREAA